MLLASSEITALLAECQRRSKRSNNSPMNHVLFRLSCCVGHRVGEIADLQPRDIVLTDFCPHVIVQAGKGSKRRKVPLWLDRSALAYIIAWKALRGFRGSVTDRSVRLQPTRKATRPTVVRSRIAVSVQNNSRMVPCTRTGRAVVDSFRTTRSRESPLKAKLFAGPGARLVGSQQRHYDERLSSCRPG